MKFHILKSLFLSGFVVMASSILGSAQSMGVPPIAPAKVAVVYSDAFADQKLGITKFLAVQKKINGEFKETQDGLLKLKNQIDGIEKELINPPPVADPKALGDKKALFERLKREFGFKSGEANNAFDTRYDELVKPVSDEVAKAMADFAKKNSIDILIDASKTGGVYVFSNAADVTPQFIAYFNAQAAKPK